MLSFCALPRYLVTSISTTAQVQPAYCGLAACRVTFAHWESVLRLLPAAQNDPLWLPVPWPWRRPDHHQQRNSQGCQGLLHPRRGCRHRLKLQSDTACSLSSRDGLTEQGLFQNAFGGLVQQVFLGMGNSHQPRLGWVLEMMMAAPDARQVPAICNDMAY